MKLHGEVNLNLKRINIEYDEETDVLYLSSSEPKEAEDSVQVEDGIIYRLAGDEIVGITITHLKNRISSQQASA